MLSSSRLLLQQRTVIAGRTSVLNSRRTPPLKRFPSHAVNFSSTSSSTGGGAFFNRNKSLLKRGAFGLAIGLGGYTAFTMQRNKADWQDGAKAMQRICHPSHSATIEEDLAHIRHWKTLDEKDLTWYDIGKTYYTVRKRFRESKSIDVKPDPEALLALTELTIAELKEKLKRGDVRGVKIVKCIGTDLAKVECQTRGDKSGTLSFHMKLDESWTGCHFLCLADEFPYGVMTATWKPDSEQEIRTTIIYRSDLLAEYLE